MFIASRPAALAFLIVPLLGVNVRSCRHVAEQIGNNPKPVPAVGKAAPGGTKPRSFGESLTQNAVRAQRANLAHQRVNRNLTATPQNLINDPDLREGDRLRAAGEFTEAQAAYQRGQAKAESRFGKESPEAQFFRLRLLGANPFSPDHWRPSGLAPSSTFGAPRHLQDGSEAAHGE